MAQDSSKPDFWESRYRDHVMPWDAGKVPAALREYARNLSPGARILIPGCGSAYEAAYLSDKGFDVLAIDFSPAAVEIAHKNLGHFGNIVRLAVALTGGWLAIRSWNSLAGVFVAQAVALVIYGSLNAWAIAGGAWFGRVGWPRMTAELAK